MVLFWTRIGKVRESFFTCSVHAWDTLDYYLARGCPYSIRIIETEEQTMNPNTLHVPEARWRIKTGSQDSQKLYEPFPDLFGSFREKKVF